MSVEVSTAVSNCRTGMETVVSAVEGGAEAALAIVVMVVCAVEVHVVRGRGYYFVGSNPGDRPVHVSVREMSPLSSHAG